MHGKRQTVRHRLCAWKETDSEAQTVCMERQTVRHRLCAWKDRDSEEQTVCMERQRQTVGHRLRGKSITANCFQTKLV